MSELFDKLYSDWMKDNHPLIGATQNLLSMLLIPRQWTANILDRERSVSPGIACLPLANMGRAVLAARAEFRNSLSGPETVKRNGYLFKFQWVCPYCKQADCDDAVLLAVPIGKAPALSRKKAQI